MFWFLTTIIWFTPKRRPTPWLSLSAEGFPGRCCHLAGHREVTVFTVKGRQLQEMRWLFSLAHVDEVALHWTHANLETHNDKETEAPRSGDRLSPDMNLPGRDCPVVRAPNSPFCAKSQDLAAAQCLLHALWHLCLVSSGPCSLTYMDTLDFQWKNLNVAAP